MFIKTADGWKPLGSPPTKDNPRELSEVSQTLPAFLSKTFPNTDERMKAFCSDVLGMRGFVSY